MPNRYLRAAFIESESINRLSANAEVTWTRLLVTADDWGRTEASPRLLRPRLFPLKLETVREADLSRWLAECEEAGLIRLYKGADGKDYLQMMKWERGRAAKSRYPEPPPAIANKCLQPLTDANDGKQMLVPPIPIPVPVPTPASTPVPTPKTCVSPSEARVPQGSKPAPDCSTGNTQITNAGLGMRSAELKAAPQTPNSDRYRTLQARLSEAFGRPKDQPWPYYEMSLLSDIARRQTADGELDALLDYRQRKPEFFPRSVQTLLEKWSPVLDQARARELPAKLSAAEMILRKTELDRVEDRMRIIRKGYGDHQNWSDADRNEFKELITRRNELRGLLNLKI